MPQYLVSIGGGDYKGWIIGLFTVSALIGRLYSGRWSDKFGRKPMILIGCIAAAFSGLGYILLVTVSGFFVVRWIHGFSTGFAPTGTTAMLSDIIPENRRGEAMGLLGFCIQIGMALGPYLGTEVALHWGIVRLFQGSTLMAFISLGLIFTLPETKPAKRNIEARDFLIYFKAIYEPQVLKHMLVMMLSVIFYGAIVTILPDFSVLMGFKNKSSFMLSVTIASMFVRIFAGKWSDQYGRVPMVLIGLFFQFCASIWFAFMDQSWELIASSAIYGLGTGILSPVLFAWSVDLADSEHRGRALSSLYIGMEFGIGFGAVGSAALLKNDLSQSAYVFCITAIFITIAWFIAYSAKNKMIDDSSR